jgi:hypothetical protein
MKVSSLLYDEVLLEAGSMRIQAGPSGATAFRLRGSTDRAVPWQTPGGRSREQGSSFSLTMAAETTPGVPSAGPYREILHSETSISWQPTLEPFIKDDSPCMRLDRPRSPG